MATPPEDVEALARQRRAARAGRDFATADALRDAIAAAGWLVEDGPDGFRLTPRPTHSTLDRLDDIESTPSALTDCVATVSLLVEGWPDDVRRCLDALVEHRPDHVGVVALDLGDVDGAGTAAQEFADAGDVEVLHLAGPAQFGPARAALVRRDPSPVHIWLESSTVLEGDAITPLLAEFDDVEVVGAGWRGVNVDDSWREFQDAPAGDVDAVLGYLFAMRTDAARSVAGDADGPFARARIYRNADIELSFWLRDRGGRLVVPHGLPVTQTRHRGYHDRDPDELERESRRTYNRFLDRFRGREDLRTSAHM
jgi:hypothetical protein